MQKRKISINYGNTDDLENENGYTFLIPDDKYQNINIKYDTKDEKKRKERKSSKEQLKFFHFFFYLFIFRKIFFNQFPKFT